PLDRDAYRKVRSASRGNGERMVAVSDFSGLVSSAWALASAAAIAPIVSLDHCMAILANKELERDCTGSRARRSEAMPDCLLCILGHQSCELRLGALMLDEGSPG